MSCIFTTPGFIVMKYPMVGFIGMAAPMKSKMSFFSVIASWILFTCKMVMMMMMRIIMMVMVRMMKLKTMKLEISVFTVIASWSGYSPPMS